jgi:hypothetical protein
MAHNFKCLSNFVHRQPVSISAVFDQHQSNPVRSTFIPFDPPAQTKRQDLSHALCTHTHTHTHRDTHTQRHCITNRDTRGQRRDCGRTPETFLDTLCQGNNFLAAVWTTTNTGKTTTTVNTLGSKSLVCVAQMLFAAQERLEGRRTSIGLGSGPLSLLRQRSPNESEETTQPSRKREAKGIYIR